MSASLRMIVGLGNPGSQYAKTRHNVGAQWVLSLAEQERLSFKMQTSLKAQLSQFQDGSSVVLCIPATFMNESGQAVAAVARYYKMTPSEILVAHDELDFSPGIVRIKQGGGHGGHNGLRSMIQHLGSDAFVRLRIGIGHPGDRDQVSDYVLSPPRGSERIQIGTALEDATQQLPQMLRGEWPRVMQSLHVGDK